MIITKVPFRGVHDTSDEEDDSGIDWSQVLTAGLTSAATVSTAVINANTTAKANELKAQQQAAQLAAQQQALKTKTSVSSLAALSPTTMMIIGGVLIVALLVIGKK